MHRRSFARGARSWPAGSLAAALALLSAPAAFGSHHITTDRSTDGQGREISDLRPYEGANTQQERPAGWSAGAVCLGSGYRRAGGSRRVRDLQRRLRARGYRPGRVDGRFGPRTRAALRSFQVKHGLAPDGAVDTTTLIALRSRPSRLRRDAGRLATAPAASAVAAAPPRSRATLTGTDTTALVVIALLLLGGVLVIVALSRTALPDEAQPIPEPGPAEPGTAAAPAEAANPTPKPQRAQPETDLVTIWRPADRNTRAASAEAANPTPKPQRAQPEIDLVKTWRPADRKTRAAPADAANPTPNPQRAQPETDRVADRQPAEPVPAELGRAAAPREAATPTLEGASRYAAGVWCVPPAGLAGERRPGGPGLREPGVGRVQGPPPADLPARLAAVPPRRLEHVVPIRPNRVLGYMTVPSGQAREAALDPASEMIADWCEQHGWELTRVIHDIELGDRPGLDYVLDRIGEGAVAGLVMRRMRDLADSLAQLGPRLRWLVEADAVLIALDYDIDTSTAAGRLAADALIEVSEWERTPFTEPSRRALTTTRSQRAGAGRAAVRDDPDLSARIQAMRARGLTLQAIADTLNREQVPTVRGGRHWRPSSVQAAIGYKRPAGRAPGIETPRTRHDPGIELHDRPA